MGGGRGRAFKSSGKQRNKEHFSLHCAQYCHRNYSLQALHKLAQTTEELLLDDIHRAPRGFLPPLPQPLVKGLFVLLPACWGHNSVVAKLCAAPQHHQSHL